MRPVDVLATLTSDQRCRAMTARAAEHVVCICRSSECLSVGIHAVIEGMTIAAYAAGACHGYVVCRACMPNARTLLDQALTESRAVSLLGDNIFDCGVRFTIEVLGGTEFLPAGSAWSAGSQIWTAVPGIILSAERYATAGLKPKTRAAAGGKV
jgi:hypothetical protein